MVAERSATGRQLVTGARALPYVLIALPLEATTEQLDVKEVRV